MRPQLKPNLRHHREELVRVEAVTHKREGGKRPQKNQQEERKVEILDQKGLNVPIVSRKT